jgi:hypothetical protein
MTSEVNEFVTNLKVAGTTCSRHGSDPLWRRRIRNVDYLKSHGGYRKIHNTVTHAEPHGSCIAPARYELRFPWIANIYDFQSFSAGKVGMGTMYTNALNLARAGVFAKAFSARGATHIGDNQTGSGRDVRQAVLEKYAERHAGGNATDLPWPFRIADVEDDDAIIIRYVGSAAFNIHGVACTCPGDTESA